MLKWFDFLLPLNNLPPLSFTYPTCLQLLYSDLCCSLLSLKKLQYLIQIWVCLSRNSLHSVVPSFQVIVCSGSTVGIVVPHTWSKLPIHPGLVKIIWVDLHLTVVVSAKRRMFVCLAKIRTSPSFHKKNCSPDNVFCLQFEHLDSWGEWVVCSFKNDT